MKKWKQVVLAFVLVTGMGAAVMPADQTAAINVFQGCKGRSEAVCKASKTDTDKKATSFAKKIINTMLYLLGIISVIMIVVGGIRYTTSAGDASRVKASKDTIMYALVGLVVALSAWSIVNFVVTQI